MQIVPMRDLKNTVEIEKRCSESGEPVFVTKNGYGRLVVMNMEVYERTILKAYEAKLVNEAVLAYSNGGKVFNSNEVEKEIMAQYGKQI